MHPSPAYETNPSAVGRIYKAVELESKALKAPPFMIKFPCPEISPGVGVGEVRLYKFPEVFRVTYFAGVIELPELART